MSQVAVVANSRKVLAGGLSELRRVLADVGITDPLWYEVTKSKQAPKRTRLAIEGGADLIYVWGGDGMVQQVIDATDGSGVVIAILPAGTANLLATNLGIPTDLRAAVELGIHGARRALDLGVVNGERFAVMAGTGLDALMIRDASRSAKEHFGRVAYLFTGAKHLRDDRVRARIKIDGAKWFKGPMSCVLFGNVGSLFGGVTVFEDAEPDDGRLEVGLVTASSASQWARALVATATGHAPASPFVQITTAHKVDVRLQRAVPFELDGGDRPATRRLRIKVQPKAVTICVPKGPMP
jgi:diacylglycerol kinase family enzyme